VGAILAWARTGRVRVRRARLCAMLQKEYGAMDGLIYRTAVHAFDIVGRAKKRARRELALDIALGIVVGFFIACLVIVAYKVGYNRGLDAGLWWDH
jgi:hypothetical protein